MSFDFDREIDRRGTDSLKYDFAERFGYPVDVLPLWVADMDFQAPPAALRALRERAEHGIFGYTDTDERYYAAAANWFSSRFGWRTEPDWLVKTPGVVYALAMAVRALTEPGDAVLIQPPVYAPFFSVVRENGRRILENRLLYRDGRYEIDWDDLERKLKTESVRLVILCSPHNPVGRVWTAEELRRLGGLCGQYGAYVASDEIHCDFAFPEHPHTVFAAACPELKDRCIVCTAPSKTFNLAGLQVSNIWIPGEDARRRFRKEASKTGLSLLNTLGLAAAQAAYEEGGPWLDECRAYMRGNLAFLRAAAAERLPGIRLVEPEGTYFAWLDCTELGLDGDGLEDLIVRKARLWLDAGRIFGGGAERFQRVVLACTRRTLSEAVDRLSSALPR